jgi:hypothetical protein
MSAHTAYVPHKEKEMTDNSTPTTQAPSGYGPSTEELAAHLADQRLSVLQGAFRILGWPPLRFVLADDSADNPAANPSPSPCTAPEHVWVTALDGDNEPARDADGRTWVHCGVCGEPRMPGDRPGVLP